MLKCEDTSAERRIQSAETPYRQGIPARTVPKRQLLSPQTAHARGDGLHGNYMLINRLDVSIEHTGFLDRLH